MKDAFITRRFSAPIQKMIEQVNLVMGEYQRGGFKLSLRQLYYQFVARDLFPEDRRWSWNGHKWVRDPNGTKNADPNYKWLGSIVSDGRQAGQIDWDMIEDRGRDTVALAHWEDPAEIVRAAARSFRIDKWFNQPWHIEVMVEKDALSGVLVPVCNRLDVAITANKGYSSSSTMYEIGQRLESYFNDGKNLCILYLGDHDPSGIDMTRDVVDRLCMYGRLGHDQIEVQRLALNMSQIEIWQPPENPAKETDARYHQYVLDFGEACWELDAVEPNTLAELVTDAVFDKRDVDLWQAALDKEAGMLKDLQEFARGYKPK